MLFVWKLILPRVDNKIDYYRRNIMCIENCFNVSPKLCYNFIVIIYVYCVSLVIVVWEIDTLNASIFFAQIIIITRAGTSGQLCASRFTLWCRIERTDVLAVLKRMTRAFWVTPFNKHSNTLNRFTTVSFVKVMNCR